MYKPVGLLTLFILLTLAIRIEAVQLFDERVIEAAVSLRGPWVSEVMLWITELGTTAVLLPLLLLSCAVLYFYKKTPDVVFLPLLFLIERIMNIKVKELIERARPAYEPLVHETSYSFPSGHSMNAAVIYPVIAYLFIKHVPFFAAKKRIVSVCTGILVILIGISRIYLGAHFPTDVLAGFSLGLCLVSLFAFFDEKYHPFRQK
ncbi:phosphatase PAP2 family protein [Bacillus sp. YC2]|uniref:phosphatase PAP2 family protein n=1 Tax=Bacillus sp. YC2 TaxID=2861287 RepID=UPI001CA70E1B|nr:phosphatase PAP2 family protein [Bacillus sp. YC2]MBY8914033.1 phosphatase PAP2 family protein [Bacillus sp. YC2]